MLVGMINHEGALLLDRKGSFIEQTCPRSVGRGFLGLCLCGDWCPHFSEPVEVSDELQILELCGGKKLTFCRLVDYRSDDRTSEILPHRGDEEKE